MGVYGGAGYGDKGGKDVMCLRNFKQETKWNPSGAQREDYISLFAVAESSFY